MRSISLRFFLGVLYWIQNEGIWCQIKNAEYGVYFFVLVGISCQIGRVGSYCTGVLHNWMGHLDHLGTSSSSLSDMGSYHIPVVAAKSKDSSSFW